MVGNGGSAFPSKRFAVNGEERDTMGYCVEQGMTLYDACALSAINGLCARGGAMSSEDIVDQAMRIAKQYILTKGNE